MIITPDSQVILLKNIRLAKDSLETFSFTDLEEQENFFKSKLVASFTDLYYLKENTKRIRLEIEMQKVFNVNYCMFKNTAFNNKWFYAYITDIIYLNNTTVEFTYELDYWQTYLFDKKLVECFVEREHVEDDTMGINTVPESLETGEYVVQQDISDSDRIGCCVYALNNNVEVTGEFINNIYSPLNATAWKADDLGILNDHLTAYSATPDLITHISSIPYKMIDTDGGVPKEYEENPYISQLKRFGNYHPVNNKLFTYPYSYVAIDDFNGNAEEYRWEDFKDKGLAYFRIKGSPNPRPAIMIYPEFYKGMIDPTDLGIVSENFPLCAWTSSAYTQWVAFNGTSNFLSGGASGLVAVASMGVGNTAGVVAGISGVVNAVKEVENHKRLGNTLHGSVGNGNVNIANGYVGFRIREYSIKPEFAKITDEYFTRYGYAINRYKVPNITGHAGCNFVKTNNAKIVGNIPQSAQIKMQADLNTGFTFWHNPETAGTL